MAQTDPALHVVPDPILEALRMFYHRGLAILAQAQMERQAAEFGETLEGDPHPAASDAPVKEPDTRFGEIGTATQVQIAETLGQDKSYTRASGCEPGEYGAGTKERRHCSLPESDESDVNPTQSELSQTRPQ